MTTHEVDHEDILAEPIDEDAPRGIALRVTLFTGVIVIVLATAVLGMLYAIKVGPFAPNTLTVHGTMSVPEKITLNSMNASLGERCAADDGYDDIAVGTDVTVKDNDGHTVAIGELGSGTLVGDASDWTNRLCSFPFTVTIDDATSDFYSIKMGRVSRGEVDFPVAKLTRPVRLSIGD
jgi:hypothetical protein